MKPKKAKSNLSIVNDRLDKLESQVTRIILLLNAIDNAVQKVTNGDEK